MRVLDLFCGAGGAAMGYHRAWPDAEIVGVDVVPQPRYPFTLVQADAMTYPLEGFDFIHASPPCQAHSSLAARWPGRHGSGWMLAATLERLAGHPAWVVENVPGADFGRPTRTLCGSAFGLKVRRHRLFATNLELPAPPACLHKDQGTPVGVYGHGGGGQQRRGYLGSAAERREAMGIDWMRRAELSQAIPPAYTEWIGHHARP